MASFSPGTVNNGSNQNLPQDGKTDLSTPRNCARCEKEEGTSETSDLLTLALLDPQLLTHNIFARFSYQPRSQALQQVQMGLLLFVQNIPPRVVPSLTFALLHRECAKADFKRHKRFCDDLITRDYTAPIVSDSSSPRKRTAALITQQILLESFQLSRVLYCVFRFGRGGEGEGTARYLYGIDSRIMDPAEVESLFAIREKAFLGDRPSQGSLHRYVSNKTLERFTDFPVVRWTEQFRKECGLSLEEMEECVEQRGEFAPEGGQECGIWDELD